MSDFLSMLGEAIDVKTKKPREGASGRVQASWTYQQLLAAGLQEILRKNSSLYNHVIQKGIKINFEKCFELPERTEGKFVDLLECFQEDMK